MALQVLHKLSTSLKESDFFTVMVDECTDSANHERLAICFRWVDRALEVHEEFFGLYEIPNIAADTIVSVITDTLLRINLTFIDVGDSVMMGQKIWLEKKGGYLHR